VEDPQSRVNSSGLSLRAPHWSVNVGSGRGESVPSCRPIASGRRSELGDSRRAADPGLLRSRRPAPAGFPIWPRTAGRPNRLVPDRRTRSVIVVVDRKAARSSTAEEFSDWARPHVRAMAMLATRLTSMDEADDVVQEALVRAWAKRARFDPAKGSPRGWLLALTADQARKARGRRRPIIGTIPRQVGPIEESLDLAGAIQRLSGRRRLATECVYIVGLSVAETAEVMKCSPGTVKSTLSDARCVLRKLLGDR
jgi:RNA polymerase sigma factor (sigma-70 family)